MPSDKNSTARGTSFRQRVKERGGVITPAIVLGPAEIRALELARAHLEAARGHDVSTAEVVRYALYTTERHLRKLLQP